MDALHTIARNLTKKRQTVSCAESCTGGMLAAAFTSVAGSSQWFEQSFVTYSNKAKEDRLGVLPETLLEHGAVSRQTVREMTRGAQIAAQADYAVGISGIAGPGGGSESKPVGTVWFGFAFPGGSCEEIRRFDGNRESVRAQAVAFALERLAGLIENGGDAV